MTHAPKATQQGFTLMETLIAAFILAIGILAAASMISRSTIQDARAYYVTQATLMAEEHIEQLISDQFDREKFDAIADSNASKTIDGVDYTMNCTVDNNYNGLRFCKNMTCVVSWNNKGIQSQVVNTYTYAFFTKTQ